MGLETERPDGGLVERHEVDFEGQGNVSDEPWENEKHEVVDATKFSSVRNFHIPTSA